MKGCWPRIVACRWSDFSCSTLRFAVSIASSHDRLTRADSHLIKKGSGNMINLTINSAYGRSVSARFTLTIATLSRRCVDSCVKRSRAPSAEGLAMMRVSDRRIKRIGPTISIEFWSSNEVSETSSKRSVGFSLLRTSWIDMFLMIILKQQRYALLCLQLDELDFELAMLGCCHWRYAMRCCMMIVCPGRTFPLYAPACLFDQLARTKVRRFHVPNLQMFRWWSWIDADHQILTWYLRWCVNKLLIVLENDVFYPFGRIVTFSVETRAKSLQLSHFIAVSRFIEKCVDILTLLFVDNKVLSML